MNRKILFFRTLLLALLIISAGSNLFGQVISTPTLVPISQPLEVQYTVSGKLMKRVVIDASIAADYSNLSLVTGNDTLLDNIDLSSTGTHSLNAVVNFPSTGNLNLKFVSKGGDITINTLTIEDASDISFPDYTEITEQVGLIDEPSLKYGGPSIADIDNDGDYDFILNNHNDAYSKLFWNNGDGTVTKHTSDLALWKQMDLHGSAAGDYDNDGDLDIVIALGGGNGTNPTLPVFYKNENGTFVRSATDVGITSGARGRAPRWGDFDLDGDLDLALINAAGINGSNGAQHIFYANKGDGTFSLINVSGLEAANCERVLMTDLNNDYIDDFVLFSPLSIWIGNGDFTFTDVTAEWLSTDLQGKWGIQAATDVDIDNDGDLDLYLTMGEGYYEVAVNNSVDFDPLTKKLDMRLSGDAGVSLFELTADDSLSIYEYEHVYRSTYNGDYPIFLGSAKISLSPDITDTTYITQQAADGWPADRTENGVYIGYVGNGKWNVESHRNTDVYWSIHFSIDGAHEYSSAWAANNRNHDDILLRNDNGAFVDVSEEWNIPKGGNHWGVTTGDFNNDTHQDLLVHRFGYLKTRLSDYMLLNTGDGNFEITTNHKANDAGARCHGDMGQAFDFDLDGDVDILNGDDEYGVWHLYQNNKADNGNYAIVKVGYSPISNVDPISADIVVKTKTDTIHKRVSSTGEVFSQSLLNMVHFGLGDADSVQNITVRWRNGEVAYFNKKEVNQIFDTDKVDPTDIAIVPHIEDVRVGTKINLELDIIPIYANRDVIWKSEDKTIASVDSVTGEVTGLIEGQSTKIIVESKANGLTDTAVVNVVAFYSIPATSVTLSKSKIEVTEGNIINLSATVLPKYADNDSLAWESSAPDIVSVDYNGVVTAKAAGEATITVYIEDDKSIKDEVVITVTKLMAINLSFDNKSTYLTTEYLVGDSIEVTVNYHAGTGNTIISSTNGGVKFWLRQLSSDWASVINDYTVSDASAIGMESGIATAKIPLTGVTPSDDLENDEFYYLWVTMAISNGETRNINAFKIKVVDGSSSVGGEVINNNIKMYPNPTTDNIYFSGLEGSDNEVTIIGSMGNVVLSKSIDGSEGLFVGELQDGLYFVKIENDTVVKTFTLVKE